MNLCATRLPARTHARPRTRTHVGRPQPAHSLHCLLSGLSQRGSRGVWEGPQKAPSRWPESRGFVFPLRQLSTRVSTCPCWDPRSAQSPLCWLSSGAPGGAVVRVSRSALTAEAEPWVPGARPVCVRGAAWGVPASHQGRQHALGEQLTAAGRGPVWRVCACPCRGDERGPQLPALGGAGLGRGAVLGGVGALQRWSGAAPGPAAGGGQGAGGGEEGVAWGVRLG